MTGSTRPWRAHAVTLALPGLLVVLAVSCGLLFGSPAGAHPAAEAGRVQTQPAQANPAAHPVAPSAGTEPAPSCHRAPEDGSVPAVRGAVQQQPSLLPAEPRPGHEAPDRAHSTPAVSGPAPVRPPRPVDLSVLRV
jgi:hypothetical protein